MVVADTASGGEMMPPNRNPNANVKPGMKVDGDIGKKFGKTQQQPTHHQYDRVCQLEFVGKHNQCKDD
jgi:hypothetical protein